MMGMWATAGCADEGFLGRFVKYLVPFCPFFKSCPSSSGGHSHDHPDTTYGTSNQNSYEICTSTYEDGKQVKSSANTYIQIRESQYK